MKKFFTWMMVAALTAALSVPAFAASGFTDIPSNSSLAGEIEKADEYGLMNGYTASLFGYSDPVTRVQFVTVIGRMLGWISDTSSAGSRITSAMQVPASLNASYRAAIDCAVQHDVVETDTAFRPSAPITRGEMAEMLVRSMGLKYAASAAEKENTLPFTDVTSGRGYVAVAYAAGMTNGTTAGTFSPGSRATRAQAAAMLVRVYEKLHQGITWNQAFYAISSYGQLNLTETLNLNAVSAGWSRMTWDGTGAKLSTTSANGNEYYIPSGYDTVVGALKKQGRALNLSVYMDTSGGLSELLSSESGRGQAVEQIVNELTTTYKTVGENPYAGVTIDFEGLRAAQRSNFTAFLTELSRQVKTLNKSLYVCVSPVLTTGAYYDGYDNQAIGQLADKVIVMAYDYDSRDLSDYVGTEYYKTAAPVPIDQVYQSLLAVTDVRTGVADAGKIVLGMNTKSVAWKIDADGKLLSGTPVYPDSDTVSRRLAQSDTQLGWSNAYQCSYAVYTTEDGSRYFLWYQNADARQAELNVACLLGIHGVSIWRLGTIPSDWS